MTDIPIIGSGNMTCGIAARAAAAYSSALNREPEKSKTFADGLDFNRDTGPKIVP